MWAIEVDGEAVGGIGIELHSESSACRRRSATGWRTRLGRGIATEALRAVTVEAFKRYDITRLYAVRLPIIRRRCACSRKRDTSKEGLMRQSAIKEERSGIMLYATYKCIEKLLLVVCAVCAMVSDPTANLRSIDRRKRNADHRQHHARAGAGRQSAQQPALVRRFEGGLLRVADAKGGSGATWVISRDGGTPRRLSETERRNAPLPNGQWDTARRRVLGVDRGDIVLIDTVARKRIDVTRTTATESSPRWARGETHVTFVRDNNLFIVPVESVSAGSLVQLTDVSTRRTDPRTTDSQKFLKDEEAKLLDWVEEEAARRKRREASIATARCKVRAGGPADDRRRGGLERWQVRLLVCRSAASPAPLRCHAS